MATTTQIAADARAGGAGARALRAALFERVIERIHRYFVKLVWDPQAVDDCLQKTLLLLERSLQEGGYDPARSFNRWMWLKAHSVYVDHCRERARAPAPLPEGIEERGGAERAGGAAAVEAGLDAEIVLARLRADLDPEALEAFVLRYGEGHTVTEVAALLGRDRKTVRKWIEAGERIARRLLGGEDGG